MLKAGTALFLKQIQTGQTTPVLKIPMSAMYFSLVLTFGLILLIQTVILVEKIIDLKNKEAEAWVQVSSFSQRLLYVLL